MKGSGAQSKRLPDPVADELGDLEFHTREIVQPARITRIAAGYGAAAQANHVRCPRGAQRLDHAGHVIRKREITVVIQMMDQKIGPLIAARSGQELIAKSELKTKLGIGHLSFGGIHGESRISASAPLSLSWVATPAAAMAPTEPPMSMTGTSACLRA